MAALNGRGVSGMTDPVPAGEDFDEAAEYDAWVATVAEAAAAWSRSVADAEAALGKTSGTLASLRKLTRDEVSDDDQRDAGVAMGSIRAHLLMTGQEEAPSASECGHCGDRITLLGGAWTTEDGTTACTDTSAPYVPHKPKEAGRG
jgi:hypothetical protein